MKKCLAFIVARDRSDGTEDRPRDVDMQIVPNKIDSGVKWDVEQHVEYKFRGESRSGYVVWKGTRDDAMRLTDGDRKFEVELRQRYKRILQSSASPSRKRPAEDVDDHDNDAQPSDDLNKQLDMWKSHAKVQRDRCRDIRDRLEERRLANARLRSENARLHIGIISKQAILPTTIEEAIDRLSDLAKHHRELLDADLRNPTSAKANERQLPATAYRWVEPGPTSRYVTATIMPGVVINYYVDDGDVVQLSADPVLAHAHIPRGILQRGIEGEAGMADPDALAAAKLICRIIYPTTASKEELQSWFKAGYPEAIADYLRFHPKYIAYNIARDDIAKAIHVVYKHTIHPSVKTWYAPAPTA